MYNSWAYTYTSHTPTPTSTHTHTPTQTQHTHTQHTHTHTHTHAHTHTHTHTHTQAYIIILQICMVHVTIQCPYATHKHKTESSKRSHIIIMISIQRSSNWGEQSWLSLCGRIRAPKPHATHHITPPLHYTHKITYNGKERWGCYAQTSMELDLRMCPHQRGVHTHCIHRPSPLCWGLKQHVLTLQIGLINIHQGAKEFSEFWKKGTVGISGQLLRLIH